MHFSTPRRLWLFLGTLLYCALAGAQTTYQPGYIVRASGDTVAGEIRYVATYQQYNFACFRPGPQAMVQCYQPQDIVGYGLRSGSRYEVAQLPGYTEPLFVQVLAHGRATLYKLETRYYARKAGFDILPLISRDTTVTRQNTTFSVTDRRYVNTLGVVLMADCPAVEPLLARSGLNDADLVRIFDVYNACTPGSQPVRLLPLPPLPPKFTVRVGLGGGLRRATTTFVTDQRLTYFVNADLAPTRPIMPSFDSWIIIGFPRIDRHLGLQTGVTFFNDDLRAQTFIPFNDRRDQRQTAWMQLARLQIPLLLRYEFPLKAVAPYVAAGASINVPLWADGILRLDDRIEQTISTYEQTMLKKQRVGVGLNAAAGVVGRLTGRLGWLIEARYNAGPGVDMTLSVTEQRRVYNAVQVSAGITIRTP